jgi:cold shock CspA family protein
VQATVHRFDAATGSGALVTDAGVLLPFDETAFATSGLRHLRGGQRLTLSLDAAGVVVGLRLESVARLPGTTSRP